MRSHQQLVATLPRMIDPFPAVTTYHILHDLPFGRRSASLVRLNEEGVWTLSRGLLLVQRIHIKPTPPSSDGR